MERESFSSSSSCSSSDLDIKLGLPRHVPCSPPLEDEDNDEDENENVIARLLAPSSSSFANLISPGVKCPYARMRR